MAEQTEMFHFDPLDPAPAWLEQLIYELSLHDVNLIAFGIHPEDALYIAIQEHSIRN